MLWQFYMLTDLLDDKSWLWRLEMVPLEIISVIIPVFKVQDYLDRCIESVVNQTYSNLEIIIVDDGSPDECPAICDRWAAIDNRISVIHQENGGVSIARNVGLKKAKGEWISFVDSDDWLHPQFFEILLNQAHNVIADVIVSDHLRTEDIVPYEKYVITDITFSQMTIDKVFRNSHIRNYVWGKIYKAELLRDKAFDEDIIFGEDTLFNVLVLGIDGIKVYYTSEQLYFYYERDNSAVNTIGRFKQTVLYEKFIELAILDNRENMKKIYLTESMKRALRARYSAKFIPDLSEITPKCKEILNKGLKEYLPLKSVPLKHKIAYAAFVKVPQLYRLWRIIDDPSMLKWEKSQSLKNRCR